jgi:hypothetical protein
MLNVFNFLYTSDSESRSHKEATMKSIFLPPTIQRDMLLTRLAGEYHRRTGEEVTTAFISVETVLSRAVVDYVLEGAQRGLSTEAFWSWLEDSVQEPDLAITTRSA